MTAKYSTALRNYLLDGGSLKAAMADGLIKVYTGSEPASADAAATGTQLATYSDNSTGAGLDLGTAAGGTIAKAPAQVWSGNAVASGTPGYFRWVLPADDGTLSSSAMRVQGKVGLVSDPSAQLALSSLTITAGAPLTIDTANITVPAE
ncbi:hypothetical protein D3C86_1067770 [compost metagenome]